MYAYIAWRLFKRNLLYYRLQACMSYSISFSSNVSKYFTPFLPAGGFFLFDVLLTFQNFKVDHNNSLQKTILLQYHEITFAEPVNSSSA